MATSTWLAATSGQRPQAGQICQFLGTHSATYLYAGASRGGQTTLGSGTTTSNGLYIAQSFTTSSAFSLGRVALWLSSHNTPGPTAVSIQTNSAGAPSGTMLASTTVPVEYVSATAAAVTVPVPCSLAASTQYWIVLAAAGDASDFYSWWRSNQTSGASTSTNGTSWSTQTYGLYYSLWDQSATGSLTHTYEDTGARWTAWTWSGSQLTGLAEWTQGQTAAGYAFSSRTLAYSSGALTTVT